MIKGRLQRLEGWCNGGEAAREKPLPQPRPAQVPETSETPWTQKDFIGWAKSALNLDTKDIGPALVAGGFTGFDPLQLEAMKVAVQSYAQNKQEPV